MSITGHTLIAEHSGSSKSSHEPDGAGGGHTAASAIYNSKGMLLSSFRVLG